MFAKFLDFVEPSSWRGPTRLRIRAPWRSTAKRVIVRRIPRAIPSGAPGSTSVLRVLARPTTAGTTAAFQDVLMVVSIVQRCADRQTS